VFPSHAAPGGTNAVLYTAALADDDVIEVFRSVRVRSVTTSDDEEMKIFHGAVQLLRAQTGVRLTEREGTGSGNRKVQTDNYRRDVALSRITSIFVEEFGTPDSTLCGRFAAQLWPLSDHGGSVARMARPVCTTRWCTQPSSARRYDGRDAPTPSSAKPLLSH
jgi:hypothetical protein